MDCFMLVRLELESEDVIFFWVRAASELTADLIDILFHKVDAKKKEGGGVPSGRSRVQFFYARNLRRCVYRGTGKFIVLSKGSVPLLFRSSTTRP